MDQRSEVHLTCSGCTCREERGGGGGGESNLDLRDIFTLRFSHSYYTRRQTRGRGGERDGGGGGFIDKTLEVLAVRFQEPCKRVSKSRERRGGYSNPDSHNCTRMPDEAGSGPAMASLDTREVGPRDETKAPWVVRGDGTELSVAPMMLGPINCSR